MAARTHIIAGLLSLLVSGMAWAGPANDLEDLRGRIHQLQRELSATEGSKHEAVDALRKSERAISEINRVLRKLDQQHQALQSELGRLHQRSSRTQDAIGQGQAALAALLRHRYEQGASEPLSLLLSGKDPDDIARQMEYLEVLARSRAETLQALHNNLQTLAQVTAEREQKLRQLAQVQAEQASQRKRLQAENQERAKLVANLSSKMKKQKRSLQSLKKDEKRLTRLVEDINRMLARREKERRRRREERKQAGEAGGKQPPAVAMIDKVPEFGYDSDGFARMKGHLRLPVAGELMNRFGSPRSDTGLSWRGLFIRAPEGREVKAVASGRVVFADWLRGFGNLLIIDHGGSYMSLYGGVQSLFVQVGDLVKGGTTVASAGSTGGNSQSGLYFELRYQSKPFDPMTWVGRP
ncbi:MAG: peptidoglycan DD-metalloendopeptidase family protein [Betaproteobacteria bacterium]|nr:peptidoglycan DD-metalloendopeptidase family protein [Betaproteobacteria bacterium]MDE2623302.1 peptidoglycan DD-metalloendopeptidase family protein [Betaproteobacteria bacterium]